jgi:hypothetical protein
MSSPVPGSAPLGALLADFSLDITSKELGKLDPGPDRQACGGYWHARLGAAWLGARPSRGSTGSG